MLRTCLYIPSIAPPLLQDPPALDPIMHSMPPVEPHRMHLLHTLLTHQNLTLTAIPHLQIHCVVAATALSRPTRVVLTQQLV
jgi:hypothetical protein